MKGMIVFRTVVSVAAMVSVVASTAVAMNIETVPVGNPGNAGELSGLGAGGWGPDAIVGGVAYTYNNGKHEVTAGQYTGFLNAVAATDTYGLDNPGMSNTRSGSGISRIGSSGSYVYSVDPVFVNRPVNIRELGRLGAVCELAAQRPADRPPRTEHDRGWSLLPQRRVVERGASGRDAQCGLEVGDHQ
jgi:hypothetical protein